MEQVFQQAAQDYFLKISVAAIKQPELWDVSIQELLTAATAKVLSGSLDEAVKAVSMAGMFACVISAVAGVKVVDLNMRLLRILYNAGLALQKSKQQVQPDAETAPVELPEFLESFFKGEGGK